VFICKYVLNLRRRRNTVNLPLSHFSTIPNPKSQLSADALGALKDFYNERTAREKQFADLQNVAEDDFSGKLSMDAFTEDWNASQFWYSDETATVLARQLLDGATDETRIAVVSAPSAFIQLKNLLVRILLDCFPRYE
jgi:hypothetical protein